MFHLSHGDVFGCESMTTLKAGEFVLGRGKLDRAGQQSRGIIGNYRLDLNVYQDGSCGTKGQR